MQRTTDYPRIAPGLFIPARSSVSFGGLSSKKRANFRANTTWWLKVGEEPIRDVDSTLGQGFDLAFDVPKGTHWKAGAKGVGGVLTEGASEPIRAQACGIDGEYLTVHPDPYAPRNRVKMSPEFRALLDEALAGREAAKVDWEPYWRAVNEAAERGEEKPWRAGLPALADSPVSAPTAVAGGIPASLAAAIRNLDAGTVATQRLGIVEVEHRLVEDIVRELAAAQRQPA